MNPKLWNSLLNCCCFKTSEIKFLLQLWNRKLRYNRYYTEQSAKLLWPLSLCVHVHVHLCFYLCHSVCLSLFMSLFPCCLSLCMFPHKPTQTHLPAPFTGDFWPGAFVFRCHGGFLSPFDHNSTWKRQKTRELEGTGCSEPTLWGASQLGGSCTEWLTDCHWTSRPEMLNDDGGTWFYCLLYVFSYFTHTFQLQWHFHQYWSLQLNKSRY